MQAKDTPQAQRVAIGALALIAAPSCETALTAAVTNPAANSEARAQSAVGLGKIASASAVATLVKVLSDDDLKIRSAAVIALARAARPTADGPANPAVLAALNGALRGNASEGSRVGAAQALQIIASPQSNSALFGVLAAAPTRFTATVNLQIKPADAPLRIAAAKALGFAGNQAAVDPLIAALQDPDGTVNLAARDSLAAIGPNASDALLAATNQNGRSRSTRRRRWRSRGCRRCLFWKKRRKVLTRTRSGGPRSRSVKSAWRKRGPRC